MLWDEDAWMPIGTGDINQITARYSSYIISAAVPQPLFEDTPEAVIWPQHAKVFWN